jgi:hypothetical protein
MIAIDKAIEASLFCSFKFEGSRILSLSHNSYLTLSYKLGLLVVPL